MESRVHSCLLDVQACPCRECCAAVQRPCQQASLQASHSSALSRCSPAGLAQRPRLKGSLLWGARAAQQLQSSCRAG